MVGVSLVTNINKNSKNQFYTIIQNVSFVLLLKNKLGREVVFWGAVAVDPAVSTIAA